MKTGDLVTILTGACQGEHGTLQSFGPQSDPEPWAVVRLVEHPEWCRRLPLSVLQAIPNFPPHPNQRPGPDPLTELPRDWAAGLV